jgi:hypothetical protein
LYHLPRLWICGRTHSIIIVNSELVNNICFHYILYPQIMFLLYVKKVGEFKLFSIVCVPSCNRLTKYYTILQTSAMIYRVYIKSFPDYKHLLQENYVDYKHIFFFQNVTQLKNFFTTH